MIVRLRISTQRGNDFSPTLRGSTLTCIPLSIRNSALRSRQGFVAAKETQTGVAASTRTSETARSQVASFRGETAILKICG